LNTIEFFVSPVLEINKVLLLSYQNITDLSHELRAPLFSIRSLLETLYEYDEQLNDNQRLEFLEIATNETNRLNNLVKDILDLAELENKNNYIIPQLALDHILKEVIQLNKLIAINKKLTISKTTENINENLPFNYNSSIKILSNLLNNSVKFTYPKGMINIQIKTLTCNLLEKKQIRSFLRISVVDTGIGISKKDKKNIFNRFSRGRTKTNTITGSGLGLPIIKETLAKENQELNLATNTDKGTSASFNLTSL
jgi:two-component system sensor histidine kinase NblS